MSEPPSSDNRLTLEKSTLVDLIADVWRIHKRAKRDRAPESVSLACERAMERIEMLGFEMAEMLGEPYHEGMRVRVTHREGDSASSRISECISPAIYYTDRQLGCRALVRSAEVVVTGDD